MERKPIDRFLPVLIALAIAAAAGLLYRQYRSLQQRQDDMAGLAVFRAHQMMNVRLEAMFSEWEEDLIEEADAVTIGSSEELLLRRWRTLMRSHWSIQSIRLADERGNELGAYRVDSSLVLVRTASGSKGVLPSAQAITDLGLDTARAQWDDFGEYDPRERIWFSKALENKGPGPVWCERQFGDTAAPVLQAAQLIPATGEEGAYRVLMIDVDLRYAAALDGKNPALMSHGIALFNNDGRVLASNRASSNDDIAQVLAKALGEWLPTRPSRALRTTADGKGFIAQAEALQLNGLLLHCMIAMDVSVLNAWLAPERKAEFVAVAWLGLMATLLALLAWRGSRRQHAMGLVALNAKQLQHRLDKAMGERDVLSREVHHRVKNNLQVVSSLLNLQASSLDEGAVREEFLRGKRRIDTIALVHHRLYDHPDLRNINLRGFLNQLTASIADMNSDRRGTVSIGVETHGLMCDQDTAIELGIIVCELVSNAYQHAFPHATGGHIEVEVTRVEGDLHRLVVRNNGVLPDRAQLTGPGKLGLEIVEALAEQLDGSLHVRTEGQPAFEVLFRMKRPASAEAAHA